MKLITDLLDIEEHWKGFQSDPASPYQSFSWYCHWLRAAERSSSGRPMAVVWGDEPAQRNGLLPLVITSCCGIEVARFVGGKHSNYNMPLLQAPATAISPKYCFDKTALLSNGIDAIVLTSMPASGLRWALATRPTATWRHTADCFVTDLSIDKYVEANIRFQSGSKRTRARRLFKFHTPQNPAECAKILSEFARHREAWSTAKRIPNEFAEPAVLETFLRLAVDPSSGMRLHYLEHESQMVAIAATLKTDSHESLMFISYDAHSETAKLSPGLYLISELLSRARQSGVRYFDFGLGESNYKERFGAQRVETYCAGFGLSMKGKLYVQVVAAVGSLKRRIKKNRILYRGMQRVLAGIR